MSVTNFATHLTEALELLTQYLFLRTRSSPVASIDMSWSPSPILALIGHASASDIAAEIRSVEPHIDERSLRSLLVAIDASGASGSAVLAAYVLDWGLTAVRVVLAVPEPSRSKMVRGMLPFLTSDQWSWAGPAGWAAVELVSCLDSLEALHCVPVGALFVPRPVHLTPCVLAAVVSLARPPVEREVFYALAAEWEGSLSELVNAATSL